MRSSYRGLLLGTILLLSFPALAHAGMPSITLTDMARMRIQTISFFGVGLLFSSWMIQLLWNYLRRDFTMLPRLSYGKALGMVILWGMLFVLVLTMISGARELMTPGAWEKQGATYRLASEPTQTPAPADDYLERSREKKLDDLRVSLWNYALTHQGRFPADRSAPEIPKDKWQVPDASAMRYIYAGGLAAGQGIQPLAYEPEIYGSKRLVLMTNGEIKRMDSEEIAKAQPQEKR